MCSPSDAQPRSAHTDADGTVHGRALRRCLRDFVPATPVSSRRRVRGRPKLRNAGPTRTVPGDDRGRLRLRAAADADPQSHADPGM